MTGGVRCGENTYGADRRFKLMVAIDSLKFGVQCCCRKYGTRAPYAGTTEFGHVFYSQE